MGRSRAFFVAMVVAGCTSAKLQRADTGAPTPDADSDMTTGDRDAGPPDAFIDDDAATEGGTDAGDAGPDASRPLPVPDEARSPSEPMIPWLESRPPETVDPITRPVAPPVLTPCPDRWVEVPPDATVGVATCEPWPTGGPTACPAGEARFPGDSACARLGTACPAMGDWSALPADVPPGAATLYVRAGAAAGGTGTTTSPFARVADALAVVRATPSVHHVIALAVGTYDAENDLPANVTLWGACVAGTTLSATATGERTAVAADEAGAASYVRNLRVNGDREGVRASAGATLELRDVHVEGGNAPVYASSGGTLRANGVVSRGSVRRTGVSFMAETGAAFNAVGDGTRMELTRVVAASSEFFGVAARDAAVVELDDAAVLDAGFTGLRADDTGQLAGARIVIERAAEAGVEAWAVGTLITLADLVVRDMVAYPPNPVGGYGLSTRNGARVVAQRTLVQRARVGGLRSKTAGSELVVTDGVVTDTLVRETDDLLGHAVLVEQAASVTLERVEMRRFHARGVWLYGSEGMETASLTDVRITDVLLGDGPDTGLAGVGIEVSDVGRLDARGVAIEDTSGAGILVARTGVIDLQDVSVRRALGTQRDSRGGSACLRVFGGTASGARVLLEGCGGAGVRASEDDVSNPGDVMLNDVVVRDTTFDGSSAGGNALAVDAGGTMTIDRAVVVASAGDAIRAAGSARRSTFTDVVVAGATVARGLFADSTDVTLERVSIEGSLGSGAQVNDAALGATDVAVRGVGPRDGRGGYGVLVTGGAVATVLRLEVQGASEAALVVTGEGGRVSGDDVTLLDAPGDGRAGRGLEVQGGATVMLSRFRVERVLTVGAGFFGSSGSTLDHLIVRDVGVASLRGAVAGIALQGDSSMSASVFVLDGAEGCGLQLASDSFFASEGGVARHPVGACVGSSFNRARLDAVGFVDVAAVFAPLDTFPIATQLTIAIDP